MTKLVFESVMAFSLTCRKVFLTRIGADRKVVPSWKSSITLLPNVKDNCRPNLIDRDSGNVYYVSAPNLIDCRPNIMDSSITFLHQNLILLFCVWINT